MTDFRALCAELLCSLEQYPVKPPRDRDLIDRARTALAQPQPQGPTDEELLELSQWHGVSYSMSDGTVIYPMQEGTDMKDEVLSFARAVLTRWGRPAIEPVPVTERLPEPEDCAPWPDEPDANPWCWAGKEVDGGWEWAQIGMLGVDAKNLGRVLGGGGWTHWLPHHALPVPQQEADHG
jgi:hypothetical protein